MLCDCNTHLLHIAEGFPWFDKTNSISLPVYRKGIGYMHKHTYAHSLTTLTTAPTTSHPVYHERRLCSDSESTSSGPWEDLHLQLEYACFLLRLLGDKGWYTLSLLSLLRDLWFTHAQLLLMSCMQSHNISVT